MSHPAQELGPCDGEPSGPRTQKQVRNGSETGQKRVRNRSETGSETGAHTRSAHHIVEGSHMVLTHRVLTHRNRSETDQKRVRNGSETGQKRVRNRSDGSETGGSHKGEGTHGVMCDLA